MPHRDQQRPESRSRPPRTLLEDVQGEGEAPEARTLGPAGATPPDFAAREVDDGGGRAEAKLFSCPTCPGVHSAQMMLSTDDLEGPGVPDPADVPYICCWCDTTGRRQGEIKRDVP